MTQRFPELGEIFEQRYELLEFLGSGGGGTVFKARQNDADRLIALKILHQQNGFDDETTQRFLREAKALNKISHENIVSVYHLGISNGNLPYIAMELIQGSSLRAAITADGPMTMPRIFRIMKQLCSAVECMHNAGIIHRDLKPENIMLIQKPEPDTVKIIDFGLVKVDNSTEQKLTATGLLIGSVSYMSPEQCQGKKADVRSDLYALSVCMYEMLSGKLPFYADTPVGVMYKQIKEDAPELQMRSGKIVHPELRAFIRKGMEKDPSLRFQTATEMNDALALLAGHFESDLKDNETAQRRRFIKPIAIAFSVIAICLIGVQALRQTKKESVLQTDNETSNLSPAQKEERDFKRALARAERMYGTQSLKLLPSLNNLIVFYFTKKIPEKAEPLAKQALEIVEKQNGADSTAFADYAALLANCYLDQGLFQAAEPLFKRSYSVRLQALGNKHFKIAQSLWSLGLLCHRQGKFAEAVPLYEKSLDIFERTIGLNEVTVIAHVSELASCYESQNRFDKAERLLKRAQKVATENKLAVAQDRYTARLGQCYFREQKYAASIEQYQHALELEHAMNTELEASLSRYWIAECLRGQGKTAEALEMYKQALAIQAPDTEQHQIELAQIVFGMAECYRQMGQYNVAEPQFKRSLEIREKLYKNDQPEAGWCILGLADCHVHNGKTALAEELFKRALAITEKYNDADCGYRKVALAGLAKCKQAESKR